MSCGCVSEFSILKYENCFFSESMAGFTLLLTLIHVAVSDAVLIIGEGDTVVLNHTAVLSCTATDTSDKLVQITWQRLTRGKPLTDNFFTITEDKAEYVNLGHRDARFKYVGSFSDKNGSLQLLNVSIMDEGTYTCIFGLFPGGDHQTKIPLKVLVPPTTSLKEADLTLGDKEVELATCTAARSKPPSEVTWLTGSLGTKVRATTTSTPDVHGTNTTTSVLLGVPTREINNHSVQCVINNDAVSVKETLSFTIKVQFPPLEVNITEGPANTFNCQTKGQPPPDVTWTRLNRPWPQSGVRGEGASLHFLSLSSDLNGLYVCEAKNAHGRQRGHLAFHYTSGSSPAGWILFSLLLIFTLAVAAAIAYFYKSGRLLWKKEDTVSEMQRVRQTSKSSEENQRMAIEDETEEA